MKIGIIDADLLDQGTRHPNLALMKISGYYKSRGDDVQLLEQYEDIVHYDRVYISKVFNFTNSPKDIVRFDNVEIGGTGFYHDGGDNLPDKIEHHMPDYHLYDNYIYKQISSGQKKESYFDDYLNYSIGFTTRGCFRQCDFCVNKKYTRVQKHSPISEFLDPDRKYIYLWDDNFLASSDWKEILTELNDTGKRFQFRQGLDIRLMTDKKAELLSQSNYKGDFIFAFDYIKDRELIESKLKLWRSYTDKSTKLYVLTGYESQDHIDIANTFERIRILMKYGCLPYIMRYEDYKESPYKGMYVQLARWCNQPSFLKKKSFREYVELNQSYIKTEGFVSASMRALKQFEKDHPDIAAEYFDMKWSDFN